MPVQLPPFTYLTCLVMTLPTEAALVGNAATLLGYAAAYNVSDICAAAAPAQLIKCLGDLVQVEGCCSQKCWDGLRVEEVRPFF